MRPSAKCTRYRRAVVVLPEYKTGIGVHLLRNPGVKINVEHAR